MPSKIRLDTSYDTRPVLKAKVGPDGKTLGQRLKFAMDMKAKALNRPYRQKQLLEDANRITGHDSDNPVCTQQNLSKILNNQTSESDATVAFAAALGVNGVWLQYGVGPPSLFDALLYSK